MTMIITVTKIAKSSQAMAVCTLRQNSPYPFQNVLRDLSNGINTSVILKVVKDLLS